MSAVRWQFSEKRANRAARSTSSCAIRTAAAARPPGADAPRRRPETKPRVRINGELAKRKDFTLKNSRGLGIQCSFYMLEAHDAQEYPPCVIYLHGNCGSRCDANDAVKLLLPQGIAVCCFDFSGSGYSEGDHISLGVR